ncbi:protein MNN4-like [Xiphophorus couchianus]|uniref:protein MNN4-like n=1 Tax=Xiphophorus couchianus TaxID=32473 RepID=UPI001015E404|nr:protein MNN4-like [Xiphophorus couchianus]
MSSVPPQREFINEQVTPAGETFTEFKEINVKMEEEMEDQRRLMDFTRIPRIILHRIDLPQCWVCKEEEVLNEFSNQERKSTSGKEEPEHQEFKEEEKQLCISRDEEQLVLKQETDDILVNPLNVQRIHNETEPQRNQLISHGSAEDENQDQEGSNSEDPGKKRKEEQKQKEKYEKTKEQKGRTDTEKQKQHKKLTQGKNLILVKFVIKSFLKTVT